MSSRHVEVSDSLKASVIEKIGRLSRYFDDLERADVHFSEERNPRIENKEICEVTLVGHGHYVRAKVAAGDPFGAVDAAVEKLEQQLLKLKSRLLTRYHGKPNGAKNRVREGAAAGEGALEAVEAALREARPVEPALRVVKVKRFPVNPMSLDDAILQMEMLGHHFFLFVRAETGEPSVLYQREEGELGLIELAT